MSEKTTSCIIPIIPASVNRYSRKTSISRKTSNYVIEPFTLNFQKRACSSSSQQWSPNTHPEGGLFFSSTLGSQGLFVYTDANLYDFYTESQINKSLERISNLPNFSELPPNTELVVDLLEDTEEGGCGYYFVHPELRSVFWLEAFDASEMLGEVSGANEPAHIKHEIESQYWKHCELFPVNRHIDTHELRQIILHASGDLLTSATSTSPYDSATLDRMLTLVNNMHSTSEGSIALHGRLMSIFTHQRFLNFHGQPGARLDRDVSVHESSTFAVSGVHKAVHTVLLGTSASHVKTLRGIWVDSMVNQVPWSEYVRELEGSWKEAGIYSAFLLNANMVLLLLLIMNSITSLAVQASMCLSMITCTGSLLSSLLLSKRYALKEMKQAESGVDLLSRWGSETLAIIHSIPYALLLWSILSFSSVVFVTLMKV